MARVLIPQADPSMEPIGVAFSKGYKLSSVNIIISLRKRLRGRLLKTPLSNIHQFNTLSASTSYAEALSEAAGNGASEAPCEFCLFNCLTL
jgi:hypothetical protein